MDLLTYLDENRASVLQTLADLHDMPEASEKEFKTSACLARRLEECGYDVRSGVGGTTGVIGILDSGQPGPCVGIRADMDALLYEVDGEIVASHACGHDANCTEVLSAAQAIAACGGVKKGRLLVIFQPAEEVASGALALLKSGELNGLEYLVGTHLRPKQELPMGKILPSLRHAASGFMFGDITGTGAHGARPHLGANAAEAAAAAVFAINSVHVDPLVPHSAKVTMIRCGGNSLNVIPEKAEIGVDMRAQTNAIMDDLKTRVEAAIKAGAAMCGASAVCRWKTGCPAAQDSEEMVEIAQRAIVEALGEEALAPCATTSGGEDFHYYAQGIPGLKTTVIGIGADLTPGLHVRGMTFNTEAVISAAKVLALMVKSLLG
ncbi:MAG: amidohydrolase [Synergistaceae bacterium]|jgi:amidohydrolase|nr:amidohydrolase [Synergistaceae bacterium]